jgi:hypothetical protein
MEYLGHGLVKLDVERGPKTVKAVINSNLILQAYSDPKGNTMLELAAAASGTPVRVYVPLDIETFIEQLQKTLPS